MKVITRCVLNLETMEWDASAEESYFYSGGPVEKCCGPSSQEEATSAQATSMSDLLSQNYQQQYAAQSAQLQQLNNVLSPIISAGPSQEGFSPEELANLNTSAVNEVAGNYANAERNAQTQLAGEGGSETAATNNVANQIKGSIAASGANQLSNEELGITKANWQQGNQNWLNATGEMNDVVAAENPLGYASQMTSANQNAFNEENTIQQQHNQLGATLLGGAFSLGDAALSGGMSSFFGTGNPNSFTNEFNSGALGPASSWGQNQNLSAPAFNPISPAAIPVPNI